MVPRILFQVMRMKEKRLLEKFALMLCKFWKKRVFNYELIFSDIKGHKKKKKLVNIIN